MSKRREGNGTDTVTRDRSAVRAEAPVVLDGGGQRILVRNIKPLGRGKYRGVIFGFSPSFSQEYQGLKVGDDLLFDADDVVTSLKR